MRLTLLLALAAGFAQAQLPPAYTLEGVLHVVWGDPPAVESAAGTLAVISAAPRYRAFLTTDAGESVELDPAFSAELTPGELIALNGRRVRASGSAPAQRLAAMGPAIAFTAQRISSAETSLGATPVWPVQRRAYAVLLCKFADVSAEPLAISAYEGMYGSAFGGAGDFYREVSGGRMSIEGTRVYGWYTMPQPRSVYIVNDRANLNQLFTDCVRQADPEIDFRQIAGIAMHFNAFLDCCSWGGSRTTTLDGETKTFPTMWNASWARSGTSWHEMGHSVGLPHSGGPYGRTYDSVWDVMSSSTSGRYLNSSFGFGGAHFIAYHKNLLGLIPAERRLTLTSGEWRGVLEPHARPGGNGPAYISIPVAAPARYGQSYTVELRGKTGYDLRLPRAAVIIHSVVPGRAEPAQLVDGDGDGDPNDDGVTWTVGEVFQDPAAGIEVRIDSLTATGVALTVRNNAARGPLLSHGGRTIARTFAQPGVTRDSVRVTGGSAWRATHKRSWLSLVRSSGADGDYLVYSADVQALAPGRSADTLRVAVAAGSAAAATFVVEAVVAPGTDVAALSLPGRRDTARVGVTSGVDSVYLALEGTYAGAAWTARRSSPRLFIGLRQPNGSVIIDLTTEQLSGSGSRWLYFRRGPESVAGLTVDTLSVNVASTSPLTLRLVDTLLAQTPVSIRLTRPGGQHRVAQGASGTLDSVVVSFDDPRNESLEWTAVNRRGTINRLLRTRGLGGHALRWRLDGSLLGGLATQIDTISVCSVVASVCATYVDTLLFDAAPNEMRLSASGGRSTLVRGTRQRSDSLYVQMLGAAGRTRRWSATATTTRVSFHALDAFTASASGTGTTLLRWSRATGDLAPGTYVDTITVHAEGVAGAPATYVDTLVVTAGLSVTGDVDGDGSITTGDAVMILRSIVGLPLVPGAALSRGDANCDGQVTVTDAQLILQLDVGIPPAQSCLGRELR